MWNEKLIEQLTGRQVVNDSKTPSGRVHVGSLRGVLIHDAIYIQWPLLGAGSGNSQVVNPHPGIPSCLCVFVSLCDT